MKVGERLTRTEYWARYERSRHDCIYKPLERGGWQQLENPWHADEKSKEDDLSSDWVLLSTEFFVFANSYAEGFPRTMAMSCPASIRHFPKKECVVPVISSTWRIPSCLGFKISQS